MVRTLSSGNPAHTVPLHPTALDEQLPARLRDHLQRLQLILPAISVSILALKAQNAELDVDIASVLHQHASSPLDLEIEEVEALLESLTTQHAAEVAA